MRLGELWDYFMRRKLLLLLVIVVSATVVFLGCKLGFGKTDEIMETSIPKVDEIAEIEVPKTGEIFEAEEVALAENEENGCDAGVVGRAELSLGNGENSIEEIIEFDAGVTFWGAEAPAAIIISTEEPGTENGEKIEATIITLGLIATAVTLVAGKFVFDRYVR